MALTNSGFDGTVNEAAFAYMAAVGMTDGVESAAAWAVTQGTGRQTSVAAQNGYAFAKGVLSKDTAAILTSIGTPTNGQWYLLCRHIDWTTNTVTVIALAHTTTTTTIPTAAPAGLPTMSTTPGTAWDQPLAWVWVRSSDTTMFLVDLRKLPAGDRIAAIEANGGFLSNVADLDAMVLLSASTYESRIVHVDDMNANFQAMDGVWVQIGDATFASTAARDTAYAKASAAYRVARVKAMDTSTGIISRYDGSVWRGWESDWITYTATLTGFTASAQVCRYRYTGGQIEVDWAFTVTTLTTSPTATLPVTAAALKHPNMLYTGNGSVNDTSAGTPFGDAFHAQGTSTTAVTIAPSLTAATISAFSTSSPFVWAAGDVIQGRFMMNPA